MLRSLAAFTLVSLGLFSTAACRSGGTGGNAGTGGTGNTGGTGGDGGNPTGGAGGNAGGDGGTGGTINTCVGQDATISDITSGVIGPAVKVKLTGSIAMSQKFLVSKSSTTGSCLWGVFLSDPGITTTKANSGILALSYGLQATTDAMGNSYCPKLGQEVTGGAIPDDIAPGDVVDTVGESSEFILMQCASEPNGATAPQKQLAKVCSMTKTGTAAVPAPAVFSPTDQAKLVAGTDKAFLDQWGGVKVSLAPADSIPWNEDPNDPMSPLVTVNQFGAMKLATGVEVGDKIYYRGYSNNICHEGPVFPDTPNMFNAIDGFVYLDFCTYRVSPNDKCADFDPASGDCGANLTCPPDTM